MSGMCVGYVRVSAQDQNPDRQLESMEVDRFFIEHASGKDTNRPQLALMMNFVRDGDIITVHSMDRLARNLIDLRNLVQSLTEKGVSVKFLKEGFTFSKGESSPMAMFMLSMIGALSEFERALLRERQKEGVDIAKRKGLYKGRKKRFTNEEALLIKYRVESGMSKIKLAKELNVSRLTIYKYLREAKKIVNAQSTMSFHL